MLCMILLLHGESIEVGVIHQIFMVYANKYNATESSHLNTSLVLSVIFFRSHKSQILMSA